MGPIFSACSGFVLFFVYANLFEYAFHRWLLHRRHRTLPYPYETHTRRHHRVFGGDTTYRVRRAEHRAFILFEWWQAPLLLALHAPAAWALQAASGWPIFWTGMTALAVYYTLYEYLHWCMHNPQGQWLTRTRLFQNLDAYHRLHHERWRLNFNVVLPLGDVLFGTFQGTN